MHDNQNSHATFFGLLTGAVSTAIPDSLVNYSEKLAAAIPIAVFSGLAYSAGAYLWTRIRDSWLPPGPPPR